MVKRKLSASLPLGSLESRIMDILWNAKSQIKGRTIYEEIRKDRKIAYTTVMTVLERLTKKGLATKELERDRAYLFYPAISRQKFIEESSKALLMELLNLSGPAGVAPFIDALYGLDPNTHSALEKLIKERMGGPS
jgi:predicted transcriptional regulator